MLIRDAFTRTLKLYPDKLAVIDGNNRRTFKELNDRIDHLGNALIGSGMKKGDRVGIFLRNCGEYLEIIGACAKTGIVAVPINFRLAKKELQYVLKNSQCKTLILDSEYADVVNSVRADLTDLKNFIILGGKLEGMSSYESLLADASPNLEEMPVQEDDLAMILYTSGTTGFPKGAMATQRVMGERCLMSAVELSIEPDDCFLNVLPMFHISVQVALSFLYMGATNCILRDWDVKVFCEMVQRDKVTALNMAPTILNFIVNYPEVNQYDLTSVRIIQYGGSPMPEATLRASLDLLQCDFVHGFGSTEVYTAVTFKYGKQVLEGSEKENRRLLTVGREAVMTEARVVNEDGKDVRPDEVGEVIIRGGGNFIGYWNNLEETQKKIREGWYHTGDLGTVDKDRYIFLVERKDDMIISGGENIYPKEVENVLFSHPSIFEAAVIGVPDEKWGESVKALVVLHKGEALSENDVIQYCKEHLASYKKPRSVEFVEDLPRSPAGKVLKRILREKYRTE